MSDGDDSPPPAARPRPVREPLAPTPTDDPTGGTTTASADEHAAPALQISNGIVALHKHFLGRGPRNIKTHFVGDLCVVLMSGALTAVERTLSAEGREDAVLAQRQAFQSVMAERFKAVVRETTGREVVAMLSANHVDPDLALETFVLGPPLGGSAPRA